jgi:hypothetical protein
LREDWSAMRLPLFIGPRGSLIALVGVLLTEEDAHLLSRCRSAHRPPLLGRGLYRFKEDAAALRQGTGMGSGSAVVVTVRHVEQSQARLRIRSSRPATSSGGPRSSITSRSVSMAQGVGHASAGHHQPSRLSRCGIADNQGSQRILRSRRRSMRRIAIELVVLPCRLPVRGHPVSQKG